MTYEEALTQLGLNPDIRLRQMFELGKLAAPVQQEPIAEIRLRQIGFPYVHVEWVMDAYLRGARHGSKLYLQPAQRKPLTDEEKLALLKKHFNAVSDWFDALLLDIEAAHGIKGLNT